MVRPAALAYTSRVRHLGRIVCLALLAGCAHPQPAELARTSAWATARDHGRYVTVNGLRLFAITLGSGRDVVLLHGNPASTYSWRKVMGPLAARYRVHAIDLPGFGFSDKPSDASYDTAWLAGAVVGFELEDVIERPYGVVVVYRKVGVFADRPGLTVEVFEMSGGLVTRNIVYWGAEEVASRFGRPHP